MAVPTVSASLNKTSFAPGDTMTLTVTYADADRKLGSVSIVVTDSSGNTSSPATVAYSIDQGTVAVTDSGRTWAKQSDTGTVAVFTSTA